MRKILLLIALGAASCTNPPYSGAEVVGAEDFVLDSYKIKQGKFSILEMEGHKYETLSEALLEDDSDAVHDGDTLQIVLHHHARSDLVATVDKIGNQVGYTVHDGVIRMPDIGEIKVGGLTLKEVQAKIQGAYSKEIQDLDVFVTYRNKRLRTIQLAGMVSVPEMPVNGKLRLFEVLSKARVPDSANYFKSYVVRDGSPLPVDMHRLVVQGDMSQNIVMKGGDKIFIASPAMSNIMVLGEVNNQGVFPIPSGMMPLRLALASAGGLTGSSDRRYIQIIRGSIVRPKIYTVNWKHVVRLPNDSLLVMPGDIVYVAANPIAEWNRFVEKILPTLSTYEVLSDKAKGFFYSIN